MNNDHPLYAKSTTGILHKITGYNSHAHWATRESKTEKDYYQTQCNTQIRASVKNGSNTIPDNERLCGLCWPQRVKVENKRADRIKDMENLLRALQVFLDFHFPTNRGDALQKADHLRWAIEKVLDEKNYN